MAQHRSARRGRLRGDRPRPARLRRLRPGPRRVLRRRRARARPPRAGPRRPRPRACIAAAGDLGGVVAQDLGLRFPGFVVRQCIFNTLLPILPDAYEAAGIPVDPTARCVRRPTTSSVRRPTPTALAAELDTPARRRALHRDFYGSRFWAAPGAFTRDDVDVHDRAVRRRRRSARASPTTSPRWADAAVSEPVKFFETNPVPTLVLYGPEDHVVGGDVPREGGGRVHRSASARSSCRAPATSCSGSGRTSSTRR